MYHRALVLAFSLAAAACQVAGEQDPVGSAEDQELGTAQSIALTVILTEATQHPTPIGLPTRLSISGPQAPEPGSRVDVTWSALDGDPGREPREGDGWLEISPDRTQATISLLSEHGAENDAALVLTGELSDQEISGSFTDRLFYPRAGLFVAEIQS